MPAFMTVSTDSFAEALSNPAGVALNTTGGGLPNGPDMYKSLRRPVRGIQIKDETHAVLRCITADGHVLPFLDSGSTQEETGIGQSSNYANFLVEGVQERRAEKKQIIETFGEDYILFFGEEPRMLNVSGQLLNTADFDWKNEFWSNYENLMRGTKLVDAGARLYFSFDDSVFEGYMTEATTTQTSQDPYKLPVSFQFFVTNHVTTSTIGKMTYQPPPGAENAARGQRVLQSIEAQNYAANLGEELNDQISGSENPLALTYQPDTPEGTRISLQEHSITSDVVTQSAYSAAGGGLSGVVASVNSFRESLSYTINQSLNNMKNAFYGRTLRMPSGIYIEMPPIAGNERQSKPAPSGQAINTQREEYIRSGTANNLENVDTQALERLANMRMEYVKEFADRVENDSRVLYGVDTGGDWKDTMALIGPLGWGAHSRLVAFGMRRINGNITDALTQPGVF